MTFSSHPLLKSPEISSAGKHLSAVEFHSVLERAGMLLVANPTYQLSSKFSRILS